MFDTHCHLQFGAFKDREKEILLRAQEAGVTHIMLPSTDVTTSQNAIKIVSVLSSQSVQLVAGVGIHPHHVFNAQQVAGPTLSLPPASARQSLRAVGTPSSSVTRDLENDLDEIEKLLQNKEIVAVGEIGIDRYYYKDTKYTDYRITEEFVAMQQEVLRRQLQFVFKYNRSLILHNREAKKDLMEVLGELRVDELTSLRGRTVFHCCEPDIELLNYAKEHGFFIGVDGDVTYSEQKAGFIKKVPLEMLVLETDSPFLTPEPIRSQLDAKKRRPKNEPKNLRLIAEYIANLKNTSINQIIEVTTENAKKLFGLV